MSKRKIATRGTLETPYPVRSGGQVFKVTWWDGDGPLTVSDPDCALCEGASVRLIGGQVVTATGLILA